MASLRADVPSDALEVNMLIQTQARILESDSLALKVIEDLHLEQTEDYKPKFSPMGWVTGLLSPSGRPDPKGASLENSPHRRMLCAKSGVTTCVQSLLRPPRGFFLPNHPRQRPSNRKSDGQAPNALATTTKAPRCQET